MAKKTKKDNTANAAGKNVPFWLDPKAPLALDCELVGAVNKIIWKNMHRNVFEISGSLEKAGIFTRFFISTEAEKVGELLGLVNHDIDAAKDFFFRPPEIIRNPKIKEDVRECKIALKSQLLFAGVLLEGDVLSDSGKNSQYLTLYAIFRKPKTNKCFVGLVCSARRCLKNLM